MCVADAEDRQEQEDTHHDHKDVGLAGPGDIERQVVWRHRMKLVVTAYLRPTDLPRRAGRCDRPAHEA